MKRTVVSYTTKPARAQENQDLVEKVFEELHARQPKGLRYLVLRLGDGTFLHFVSTEEGAESLTALDAFRTFQGAIKERCIVLPQAADASVVGNYRMLDAS